MLVLALLAAAVALPTGVATGAAAQESEGPAPAGHSDWAPFIGEHQMWCTASIAAPGPCRVHHNGWAIDIDVPFNDPIYAAGPGVVGWVEDGCPPEGRDGGCNSRAGNYVAVDHGDHFSRYIHLASFAEGIEVGAPIQAGQVIGFSGASGTSSGGVHLHYDEIAHPLSITQRIFFGPMLACHGDSVVQYPDVLGTTDWQQIPHGTVLRNDGYECLGGVTPEAPPPPAPVDPRPGGAVGLTLGDFNGDGADDLAMGAPGEDLGTRDDAGTVAVVYGDPNGVGSRTQALSQKRGLKGRPQSGDTLGAAVASGDFDCDGRDDLAIGVPREDLGGQQDAGAVNITYGGANGAGNRGRLIFQGKWLAGVAEAGDLTGAALATGDFDGDQCADLAVGAPGEDIDSTVDAGAVTVIYGGPGGFSATSRASEMLYQDGGLAGFTEAGDNVGATLAAGDFDCDGVDDLAVGAPSESIDGSSRAGAVSIVFGTAGSGLGRDPVTIYQSSGLAGILESGDRAAAALASGDFNGDGCGDLAVGAPGEDLVEGSEAGAVSVAVGSRTGLVDSTVHYQATGGLPDTIEAGDLTGAALASVDLNCDGFDDLAVGAPGESIAGHPETGWVGVLRGSATGINGHITALHQGGGGIPGKNEPGDLVGTALAAGNIDADSCGDLVIGIPGESIGSRANAGRVVVVLGAPSGTGTATSHFQRRNLPGRSEAGDFLGGPGVWGLLGLSLQ